MIVSLDFGNDFQENRIDAFGDAYEYLMNMYASNAGKSWGEYFTPLDVSELLTRITLGNIVCFRNLDVEVHNAISLFGNREVHGIVLLKPYAEYLKEYENRVDGLYENFPLGEQIVGEECKKDFIRLFGIILRLRNILKCFDEFENDDKMPVRDEQDYCSVYVDLYELHRRPAVESKIIDDALVFEGELLKTVDINIDYILMLVQKYKDSNCKDKVIIADIERLIKSTYDLRNKKELIDEFIDSINSSSDVDEDWKQYIKDSMESELQRIVQEENLDEEGTRDLLRRSFAEGEVSEAGTEIVAIMKCKPSKFIKGNAYQMMKQRFAIRLKEFYERFNGLGQFEL